MLPKTVITGLAAAALVIGTALIPTGASAQHGGHGAGSGGGFHGGGGFRGFGYRGYGYRGYGYWGGIYPWWGYEEYPWEPACGYVHVKYYRHERAYWRWVYQCD